jgi:hypothetical protein
MMDRTAHQSPNQRGTYMMKSILACLAFTASLFAQGGYSIFDGTMVDMSMPAVEQAAKDHAAILWPMGVIEEHGPALPLGTDIYQSYARMKRVSPCTGG